jgi:ribosomal protein L11 methylase PrmA
MALIKGAPFVPTPMEAVERILKEAHIKKGEKVFDIGCGDGRMVYLAAKEYGADATGLELSPLVYVLARIRKLIWRSKARILFRNFKNQDFSKANVIVCYLLPETLAYLQPKLDDELKKGTRVVSYAFQIGTWKEKKKVEKDPVRGIAPIWVYER